MVAIPILRCYSVPRGCAIQTMDRAPEYVDHVRALCDPLGWPVVEEFRRTGAAPNPFLIFINGPTAAEFLSRFRDDSQLDFSRCQ